MRRTRWLFCLLALLMGSASASAEPGTDATADAVRREVDRVMAAIEDDDADALARSMSAYMLTQASAERLLRSMRQRRMHEFSGIRWNPARHHGRIARVEGMGTLVDGGMRWLNMRFVRESQGWRLALVGCENADVVDEPAAVDVPRTAAIEALLRQTLATLVDGSRTRSFDALLSLMPSNAPEDLPIDTLNAELLPMLEGLDLAAALSLQPRLDEPVRIDDDHAILWLVGHYPTQPPIRFRHGYQFERGRWRLLRFSLNPPAVD